MCYVSYPFQESPTIGDNNGTEIDISINGGYDMVAWVHIVFHWCMLLNILGMQESWDSLDCVFITTYIF